MQSTSVDRWQKRKVNLLWACLFMNQSLLTTKFPAAKRFLLFWLKRTINTVPHQPNLIPPLLLAEEQNNISQKDDLDTSILEKKCSQIREQLVTKGNLSLTRVQKDTVVVYICAIAFKESQSWGTSPIDVATQIADQFSYLSSQELSDDPKKYFTLKVVPPGWLHLQLTDLGIATWLQSLAEGQGGEEDKGTRGQGDKESSSFSASTSSQSLFSVQYAHARCGSLLRLAQREGSWGAIAPDAIPWLNEKGELRLTHRAERNLISQLFSALDEMYCPASSKKLNWEKLAQEISFSWENFYRQCRIWGEVKTEVPELAQARLGLLMATQAILQLLLEDYLGVPAPLEL
ncbi:DALR anticodon-binding domain-containing protein [Aerosakkonemataceae cyanobacterium BLCC-F50]|uniref:DALR anticodon-binding domain-containing protein n=1 Tax=Floridaenema flaviceps BLCC-F50 TaxID=3153642 RepID=A0ABV4Y3B8_9CYAN